jgi:hypothetical protein
LSGDKIPSLLPFAFPDAIQDHSIQLGSFRWIQPAGTAVDALAARPTTIMLALTRSASWRMASAAFPRAAV